MNEMFNYIFSSLEISNNAVRNQLKINRRLTIFALCLTAYTVLQTKRIKNLEVEIHKLKKTETDIPDGE